MRIPSISRILLYLLLVGVAAALAAEIALLLDIFVFEYEPLMNLAGSEGLALLAALNVGLLVLGSRATCALRGRAHPFRIVANVVLLVWAVLLLWLLEWTFMETPLTVRVTSTSGAQAAATLPTAAQRDFEDFSIAQGTTDPAALARLQVMYERVRVNSPEVFDAHPLGATIDKYSQRYDVDPTMLFFFLYVGSFWGEATSGPAPFVRSMTPETVRDIVQVHLPGWFVESGVRTGLISSATLERLFGEGLGFKLRYALHKSTLDVSTQPYDLNLYSDVFLVLREYPEEFPEIAAGRPASPLTDALRSSFNALRNDGLRNPYEDPYAHRPLDDSYYDAKRSEFKKFARAAFYLLATDFDFATRAAALVLTYQRDYYRMRLGDDLWSQLPDWQKAAMLGMTRDLYMPAVGRLGYDLYALPELNCTPVEFVATAAVAERASLGQHQSQLWRPKDYQALWGGAATKLRILSELWVVIHGTALPGLDPENTVDAARAVVRRHPHRT